MQVFETTLNLTDSLRHEDKYFHTLMGIANRHFSLPMILGLSALLEIESVFPGSQRLFQPQCITISDSFLGVTFCSSNLLHFTTALEVIISYNILRQVYPNLRQVLQSATFITICDGTTGFVVEGSDVWLPN